MKKKDRRTIYTENVIKEGFLTLLRQKPMNKITVTEVCRTAEINRGTFYLHFTDCEDVLLHLQDELCDKIIDQLRSNYSIINGVLEYIHAIWHIIDQNKDAYILLKNMDHSDRVIMRVIEVTKDQFLSKWIALGDNKENNAEWIAAFIIFGYLGLEKQYGFFTKDRVDMEGIIQDVITNGIYSYIKKE